MVKTMKFTRLFNVFKRLRNIGTIKSEHTPSITTVEHKTAVRKSPPVSAVTANATARTTVKRAKFAKEFIQNQSSLDFNLTEALRLRALGWGNRKIARKMNGVSRETVRKRLRDYDAAQVKAAKPKPIPAAPQHEQQQSSNNQIETASNSNRNQSETKPVTLKVPPPVTNLAELTARRQARGLENYPLNMTQVFIVRPEHVKYGLGSEQPCIGFNAWHPEYRMLEIFQTPVKFWVLVNAEDGAAVNRSWLDSIAADIWLYERCKVLRIEHGCVLSVFQARFGTHRRYPGQAYGARLADDTFEGQFNFEPMPLRSHVQELDALSKDAVPTAVPVAYSGYGNGWTAQQPMPPQASLWDDPRPQRSEGAGGLAGQDDGTNYGK
jgi:hypothetical protein